MVGLHIYAPTATAKRLAGTKCHDCKQQTLMVMFFTPWYGWESTCIKCGRQWCDGEWMPLEFMRGIRQQNINTAKRLWFRLPPIEANHFGEDEIIQGWIDDRMSAAYRLDPAGILSP